MVAVRFPDVPVRVKEYCPIAKELLDDSVKVLLPVEGFGEKDAVTPLGRPETEKFTLPVNPYCGFT